MEKFCTQNKFIADNSDVFEGFVAWGAGSFGFDYVLSLTPSGSPGDYTDNKLMKQCVIGPFLKDAPEETSTSTKATSTKTSHSKTSEATSTGTHKSAESTQRVFKEETTAAAPSSTATEPPTSNAATSDNSSSDDKSAGARTEVVTGGLLFAAIALFHTGLRFF